MEVFILGKCETNSIDSIITYMEEENAPPRKNGELVFEEPWEGRSFGIALALYHSKAITDWEDFRSRLIEEIGKWEENNPNETNESNPDWNYYEHWLAALERLVLEKNLLKTEEIDSRSNEYLTGKREDEIFF